MAKNSWSKKRPESAPYATVTWQGWTWKILKAYQCRKNEIINEFARYFCTVSSPATQGSADMGDVYVKDIPMTPELRKILDAREQEEG